jgi:3-dehydroquinate synthase
MRKIIVKLSERSYPVIMGARLENLGAYLKKRFVSKKIFIITNPGIKRLYFGRLSVGLRKAGFDVSIVTIADGERFKTLRSVNNLYKQAIKIKLDRRSIVIALGGGVIGDVAGFFAATYMRGLPLVQVPTTLLAMVDSSVGGKTGVDLPEGKNLVGSFYQPKLVWIDLSTLKTLPTRQIRNGMSEVIKYGIIKDKAFFSFLEKNVGLIKKLDPGIFEKIVFNCCKIKADVVSKDEREEKGLREMLNFGHTFGHAIEVLGGYQKYSHGEAVSIGMNMASELSAKRGLLSAAGMKQIKNLIQKIGLPITSAKEIKFKKILDMMKRDKKVRDGKIRIVLPIKIGKVIVKEMT